MALGARLPGRRRRGRRGCARAAGRAPRLVGGAWPCWRRSRAGRWSRGRAVDAPADLRARPAGVAARPPTLDATRRRDGRARRAARPAVRALRLGRHGRPVLPALTEQPGRGPLRGRRTPTCARSTCCGRSTRSSQQRRALPGQLAPLLDLLGARTVVTGADDDRALQRRRAARPTRPTCSTQLGPPASAGARCGREPPRGGHARRAARALPQVRAWDRPGAPAARAGASRAGRDGGRRRRRRARGPGRLRRAAARPAARLRRRPVAAPSCGAPPRRRGRDHRLQPPARVRRPRGWRRTAARRWPPTTRSRPTPRCSTRSRGAARDAQTVAVLAASRSMRAPFSPGLPAVPRAPAVRGASTATPPRTGWPTARSSRPRHWLEVGFDAPARRRASTCCRTATAAAR